MLAEDADSAWTKINQNHGLFENASGAFGVDIKYLEAVVFVEGFLNYDWSDEALDVIFANGGGNSSIGGSKKSLEVNTPTAANRLN
jgi:hypothetical protein